MSCLFILVLLLCRGPASEALHAQIAGGNVSGVVTDPSGRLNQFVLMQVW
jgi:hypothetical protein